MAVGIELILFDDPSFQQLPPDARWFYVSLSLEVLDSGHQGRRLEYESVLKLAGMDRTQAAQAIAKLEEVGLLIREGGRKINLPKSEIHFRRYGDLNNNIAPNDRKDQVLDVFRHWQKVHDKHQCRLTPTRRKLIRSRLQDGYTVSNLKAAIDGCKASPYHQGDNERSQIYNDIELICRNADKVEQFMSYHDNAIKQRNAERRERTLQTPPNIESRARTIEQFKAKKAAEEDLQPDFDFDP